MTGKSAAVLKVADPPVEDPLAAYPAKYLECRVDRHQWGKAVWELISGNVSERIRQCRGCGMKRVEVINTRTWTRMAVPTKYRGAPGYAMRGKGLIMDDYRRAHYSADFQRAEKAPGGVRG
jgi:hypothetical protein